MLSTLPDEWRALAATLRAHAVESAANAYEKAAAQLEAALRQHGDEPLTLVQAARECGYSPRTIQRWIRKGVVQNIGRPNAPKVRRRDLPVKPGITSPPPIESQYIGQSREQIARAILTSATEHGDA